MAEGISPVTEEMAIPADRDQKDSPEALAAVEKEAEFRREEERREEILAFPAVAEVLGGIAAWAEGEGTPVLEAIDHVVAADDPLSPDTAPYFHTVLAACEKQAMAKKEASDGSEDSERHKPTEEESRRVNLAGLVTNLGALKKKEAIGEIEVGPSEGEELSLGAEEERTRRTGIVKCFKEDFAHALRTPLTSTEGYMKLLEMARRPLTEEELAPHEIRGEVHRVRPEELSGDSQRQFVFSIKSNLAKVRQEVLDMRDLVAFGGLEGRSPDVPKGLGEVTHEPNSDTVHAELGKAAARQRKVAGNVVIVGGEEAPAAISDESADPHLQRAFENLIADTGVYGEEGGTLLINFNAKRRQVTCLREVREAMDDGSSGLAAAEDHIRRRGWFRERNVGTATEAGRPSQGLGLKAAMAEAHLKFVGGKMEQSIIEWDKAVKGAPEWADAERKTSHGKVLETVVSF